MAEINYLTVDSENRTISVPDSETLLGVEFDEKGMRKYFRCPKIVGDNIDLTKSKVYINVQNASGQQSGKDRYAVENFKVDGSNVTFEWVLGRKVTAKKGAVKFNVCVMSNDGREWNTTFAEGTTKEGLELLTPEEVEIRGSDYLGALTADATATPAVILAPYTAFVNGEKIEGTYIPLDTSVATATEMDIENGKIVFIDGKEVVGKLPVNGGITRSGTKANRYYRTTAYGYNFYFVEMTSKIYPNNDDKKMILSGEQDFTMSVSANEFGDAKPEQILKGRTATSLYGLKIEGTLEPTGKTVKTGTFVGIGADPVTIQTGLSNVEKFIMYANVVVSNDLKSSGICSLVYEEGITRGTGASYGSYLTTISLSVGTIEINAGAVTYTPKDSSSTTNTITDVTYKWIAIGS